MTYNVFGGTLNLAQSIHTRAKIYQRSAAAILHASIVAITHAEAIYALWWAANSCHISPNELVSD